MVGVLPTGECQRVQTLHNRHSRPQCTLPCLCTRKCVIMPTVCSVCFEPHRAPQRAPLAQPALQSRPSRPQFGDGAPAEALATCPGHLVALFVGTPSPHRHGSAGCFNAVGFQCFASPRRCNHISQQASFWRAKQLSRNLYCAKCAAQLVDPKVGNISISIMIFQRTVGRG